MQRWLRVHGSLRGGVDGVGVGNLAWDLACDWGWYLGWGLGWDLVRCRGRGLSFGERPAAYLGVGVASGLSLGGGMGFGDLAFFAARSGFGNGGGLGAASGLDTLGCGGAGCFFGLAQSTAHGGVGIFGLMGAGSLCCVTCGGLCCCGGGFGLGLGQQCLFADLLGGTMSQLRAILPARGGEVAIFCAVKIGPGVEDGHIFGGLRYYWFVSLVRAARIHISGPMRLVTMLVLLELRRFAANSTRRVCTRYHAIA